MAYRTKRPSFHFAPPKGWINDPNGMVYVDGVYHLFYQYYPEDIIWGPMHWGHAVSTDLVKWEHKPIALKPDALGYAFSGSAVYDRDNVSGLGTTDAPPLILMYTSHNPDTAEQQQCITYSLDMEEFITYENNPVIANHVGDPNYQKEFRDPKIFVNDKIGGYSMALAVDTVVEFYHSQNLLDWRKTGEFHPGDHGFSGMCECPDCFPLETEDGVKWVLLLSMLQKEEDIGKSMENGQYYNPRVMQYFVGEFDGDTFLETQEMHHPLVLDYGFDNYAMVSFGQCERHFLMGWGEHWDYADKVPADDFRGKMTIAREPKLLKTKDGYRLAQLPVGADLHSVECQLKPNEKIRFSNQKGQYIDIVVDEHTLTVDRSHCVDLSISPCFQKKEYCVTKAKRYTKGACNLCVLRDGDFFEVFAENGLLVFSIMTYPDEPLMNQQVMGE